MPTTIAEVTSPAAWDRALLALPAPHILQSWAWGQTKSQTGWLARRLLWTEETLQPGDPASSTPRDNRKAGTAPAAAASVLVRRLAPHLPLAVAYVSKGPVLDWSCEALAASVLRQLESEARRSRAIFIKIDPDLRADTPQGQAVVAELVRRGWRSSAEQIQFRNTVISDLGPDEEAMLAAMKPKWRYNIRLAERKGVIVRDGTPADFPAFYAMYAETGARDGFLVRPYAYYQAIWERFLNEGLAHLLLAEIEGEPVSGLILFRFGPTAWYFYGASTAHGRDLMPNHALQWAALRWAKAAGCTRYDWWGAPDQLDESDPMWGVFRFKQGFGGEFVPGIGAWDFPTNRLLYWLYTTAMPKALDMARRRHRSKGM